MTHTKVTVEQGDPLCPTQPSTSTAAPSTPAEYDRWFGRLPLEGTSCSVRSMQSNGAVSAMLGAHVALYIVVLCGAKFQLVSAALTFKFWGRFISGGVVRGRIFGAIMCIRLIGGSVRWKTGSKRDGSKGKCFHCLNRRFAARRVGVSIQFDVGRPSAAMEPKAEITRNFHGSELP